MLSLRRLSWLFPLLFACGGRAHADGPLGPNAGAPSDGGMRAESGASGNSNWAGGGRGGSGGLAQGGFSVARGGGTSEGGTPSGGTPGTTGGEATGAMNGAAGAGGETEPTPFLPPENGPRWRNSGEPLCAVKASSIDPFRVWSDERGVYALIGGLPAVQFNDGTGWADFGTLASDSGYFNLSGFPGGPLLVTTTTSVRCGILAVERDGTSCSSAATNVFQTFPVASDLAYAIALNRLLVYGGEYWTQVGEPLGLDSSFYTLGLWANDEAAVVVGTSGNAYLFPTGESAPRAIPAPSTADAYAVWGFAANDLWLGNSVGELYHFDGASWSLEYSLPPGECSGIRGLWGSDGVLYFYNSVAVFRLRAGKVDSILRLPCDPYGAQAVRSIWGNAADELFIALQDYRARDFVTPEGAIEVNFEPRETCGAARVLYFDGTRLGQL
jgi:hypothetical protein